MNAAKLLLPFLLLAAIARAEDNRRPPIGIPVPPEIRAELASGVAKLHKDIEQLRTAPQTKPIPTRYLPDIEIYYNAVRYALDQDIFYGTNDFAEARKLLKEGEARLNQLSRGHAFWMTNTGLLVLGYVSKIDGSVQPYGLVVPVSFQPGDTNGHRLDFWFHGRGDKLSELDFIRQRETSPGEFAPSNAFVLHPYGRYCNADKFAGEVDVFEALQDAQRRYRIDTNRISVRGFSMGGAATWHLATHYAGLWTVAAPGAGFVDTKIFQKIPDKNPLPWFERKLWHLYDALDYAGNLFNCPVVAYSGEIDKQKEAADLMQKAMADEGLTMTYIIGPKTGHKYEPGAKLEVAEKVDAIADQGRDPWPREIKFTTWTLRYNRMNWITIDGLEKHWERARVDAAVELHDDNTIIQVTTTNVSAVSLALGGQLGQFQPDSGIVIVLDNQMVGYGYQKGNSYSFEKTGRKWTKLDSHAGEATLAKRHGLQGPIDDAFMDSFIFVRPTGKPQNDAVGSWVTREMTNAITQWQLQFRGEPRVKDDTAVTAADIESNHLVLWGDPESNQLLKKIAMQLPIQWNTTGINLGGKKYPSDKYVPVLIYPNPLNLKRYVVLNSGFTFDEAAHTSNALQTPKLPDYAILDMAVPMSARPVEGVADAGFFDEHWQLSAPAGH